MIKLIVSDIDGTLIKNSFSNDPYYVTEENIKAIKDLKKKNITFILATGRNHASASNVMKNINLDTYVVSLNGSYLIGPNNNQITENVFDPQETLKIMNTLTVNSIDYLLIGPNTIAFDTFSNNKITPHIVDVNAGNKYLVSQKVINEFNSHEHRVGSISIVPSPTQDFKEIEKLVRATIDNSKFDVVKSSKFTLDIVLKNISKAKAILKLCEELMITPDQVAVIGDNFNDLPMFKVFEHSYVIKGSSPTLRKFAKYEVDEVHEAIKHITEVK